MIPPIPEPWQQILDGQRRQPYFEQLDQFLEQEQQEHEIYPPSGQIFTALNLTPYDQVKVLILGQDPYHDTGQAHGLSFSVPDGVKQPPSLRNMLKELKDDLGCEPPKHGSLVSWAEQGVLLLNAVLTVRAHEPNSHKGKGWEHFTDAIISALNQREQPVVFVLWGAYARKKRELIDAERHVVIESAHPSPLSAKSGFFGSKPFSKVNAALEKLGERPINWCIS